MADNKMQTNEKKKIYLVLMVLFLIGFAISGVILMRNAIVEHNAKKQYETLLENVLATEESEKMTEVIMESETEEIKLDLIAEKNISIPELKLDWEELAETNEDVYAWIYIPETKVNYPILQHPTDDNYYLDRNLDHSKGLPGCIYTQSFNTKEFTDGNTVLYGHNMKNGTMFKTLHYYEDGEFFDANRYIYVYTPEMVLVYEIYAACEFSDAHLLYSYDFTNEEGITGFLTDLENARGMNNHVVEEIAVPEEERLITLSTCISNKPNNRWLVVGVLLGEKTIEE